MKYYSSVISALLTKHSCVKKLGIIYKLISKMLLVIDDKKIVLELLLIKYFNQQSMMQEETKRGCDYLISNIYVSNNIN